MTEDWCTECGAGVYITEEGEEEDPWGVTWWVIRYTCGCELVSQR